MKNSLNRFLAGIACTVLAIGLTLPAQAAETPPTDAIRVSSYKGTMLNTGEVSGLIIAPNAADCTAVSDTLMWSAWCKCWAAGRLLLKPPARQPSP